MFDDILPEAGATFAYGVVGIALLAAGYLVVEVTTPGKLGQQIWSERNRGAGLILAAKLLGVGAIVATSIVSSETGLGAGLVSTAVYGAVGILLMTAAFFLLDLFTPGKLGATLVGAEDAKAGAEGEAGTDAPRTGADAGTMHPACWVVAATDLATAAIVAAAIT
jgi:uncharacterized membrane protein YjfL (UPF0719 family)